MQVGNIAPDGEWIPASEAQVRNFVNVSSSKRYSNGSMRRKPLLPPPTDTIVAPLTKQSRKRRQANRGLQSTYVLTVNGRIEQSGCSICRSQAVRLPAMR